MLTRMLCRQQAAISVKLVCMMLTCCWPMCLLQKSKKCPIVIKAGLSPVSGNATWSPKEGVATATYFVRAFVMHNSSATVQYQVALGNSKGYFQVRTQSGKGTSSWDGANSMGGHARAGIAADCHALVVPGQWRLYVLQAVCMAVVVQRGLRG
jgi:hypothetical protein